jgi:hypothetical protein
MDADTQAETILKHRLPYTLAVGAVRQMTAPVVYALVQVMTKNQLQANLKSLENRGALNTPEIRSLVETKLASGGASNLRQTVAAKAITDEGIKRSLSQAEEKQISLRGTIKIPVALLIDKSSSQSVSIELSKELLPYLASASKAGLRVWAFDTASYPITLPANVTADGARLALRGVHGSGGTNISQAIDALSRSGFTAELIIVLSDEQTELISSVREAFVRYIGSTKVMPSVIVARTPCGMSSSREGYTNVRDAATAAGLVVDSFDVTTPDSYTVGQILRLAASGGKVGIVQTIIEYPLLEVYK